MLKNITKSLLITFTSLVFQSQIAQANDFYIKKGNQFELCREIKEILDEPENKDFGVPYLVNPEFPITKKHKNFRLPAWEDIPTEDANKYIADEWLLTEIQNFKQNNPYITQINSDHYIMQKTYIDLDHSGTKDEVIRYKIAGDSIVYDHDRWKCHVSDAKEKTKLSESFNYNNGINSNCYLFLYKGRAYEARAGFNNIKVYELHYSKIPLQVNTIDVCRISLTGKEESKASKLSDKYYSSTSERRLEIIAKNKELKEQNQNN